MKINRYTAATMQQALARVKAALGPEAVILETASAPGEVTVTAAVDPMPPPGPQSSELVGEVRQLLGAVRELVEEHWRHEMPGLARELLPLQRALVAQGVDGAIAAALVQATRARLGGGTPLDAALAGALGEPPPGGAKRVRLFMGPPGDGKTTTIAKLAAQERHAGRRVALVGTDTYRVGATAELETYGRALGAPVHAAVGARELVQALACVAEADVVLVDTAGAGPGQGPQLAELAALVEAAAAAARTLVASGATGSSAAARTWRAFAPLEPEACVLTKLDLGPGGPMLGLLWQRGVPVSHVAAGRRIPDDLEPATPDRLARCLLATLREEDQA